MNGRNAIFRLFCLICLSLLMAACKKDDDGGNRSPVFDTDAAVAAQMYTQNVEIAALTLPEATGGDGTLTYSLSPSLPAGLTFNAVQRTISGTPESGLPQTTFTYTATDEDGDTAELTFTISVNAMPAFADDVAIADQTYTQKMKITALTLPQAMGGDGTLTYNLSPNPTRGLTFNTAQRTLTGTPQSSLPQTEFTYTVTDEDGDTDELTFMMTINETLMPAFASDAAIANQTYTQNVTIDTLTLPTATGGDGALTYSLSPSLPRGLTFDAAQKTLTGTPEAVLTATEYTYTATDADGDRVSLTFMLTVEADVMPAFANDASVVPQIYTEGKAIADLTLPQATGGNGKLSYTLIKSDGTALPNGLTFDGTMRVLSGRPATGTAAAAVNYTLTATDADGDTDDLNFSITIRAASAMPLALTPAGTLTVAGNSTTNNTLRLTSSVAWEAVEAEDWITAVTPPTGTAALAATIALTYEGNEAFEPRTGSVTFKETTAGASPPFEVTLDVTQTAGSSLSTAMYGVPARADAAASVTLDVTLGPGVTHWWITAADGGFASTVTGVTSVSANAGTRAMRNTTAFTLNVEENPDVMDRDFELRLHVGGATGEPLSSVPFTVTQAPRPVTLGTTVYEIGAAAFIDYTITFTGLAFTAGTGVTHWWITDSEGSDFSNVNAAMRALTSATSFNYIDLIANENTRSEDIPVLLNVGKGTGEALFSVPFTLRKRGRVPDGMIPINNLEQLNAMRYDLTGDGSVDHDGDQSSRLAADQAYGETFPNVVHASGRYTGYQLARNLNFRNAGSYASGTVNTDWTEAGGGSGWLPVGVFLNDGDGTNDAAFSGTFDGGGFAIDSLYINSTVASLSLGLFGYVTGTISNIGVRIAKVTATSGYIGGLVGLSSGTISGSYASGGTITGGQHIGGLLGFGGGTISDCYVSEGTITGGPQVTGGLVGRWNSGTIRACYVSGGANTSSAIFAAVGGLAGIQSAGTINACYVNKSTFSATGASSNTGSLIGQQDGGIVTACYAGGRTYTNLRGAGSGAINYSYYEAASEPNSGDDAKATVPAKRKTALITPTAYESTGIFADWDNIDLDGDGVDDTEDTNDFWDFGENDEYPVLKGVGGTQR